MMLGEAWRTVAAYSTQLTCRHTFTQINEQTRDVISQLGLRRRGCRAGKHHRRNLLAACVVKSPVVYSKLQSGAIWTVVRNRRPVDLTARSKRDEERQSVPTAIRCCGPQQRETRTPDISKTSGGRVHVDDQLQSMPTLYVLNAAAVTKPHAVQHLAADLIGYKVDIAVITEITYNNNKLIYMLIAEKTKYKQLADDQSPVQLNPSPINPSRQVQL